MNARIYTSITLVLLAVISFGCGGAATNTANTAANTANTNTAAPTETGNSAPTLTPVFKAYCEAFVKKDEAGLRKVYSADTLKEFEKDMKESKITSLLKYLEDDGVTGNICEVRNEVITGDKAVAEIRADAYPNGIKIVFVKENGEWKMTTQSPTVEGVKQNANNAPANVANRPAADPAAKKDN